MTNKRIHWAGFILSGLLLLSMVGCSRTGPTMQKKNTADSEGLSSETEIEPTEINYNTSSGAGTDDTEITVKRITFTNEKDFVKYNIDEVIADGYTEIADKDWKPSSHESLVHLSDLPPSFQRIGSVFTKDDPGIPTLKMIRQIWYNPVDLEIISIIQEYAPDISQADNFTYSDKDMTGNYLSQSSPWSNYVAAYNTSIKGKQINAVLVMVKERSEDDCIKILTSVTDSTDVLDTEK